MCFTGFCFHCLALCTAVQIAGGNPWYSLSFALLCFPRFCFYCWYVLVLRITLWWQPQVFHWLPKLPPSHQCNADWSEHCSTVWFQRGLTDQCLCKCLHTARLTSYIGQLCAPLASHIFTAFPNAKLCNWEQRNVQCATCNVQCAMRNVQCNAMQLRATQCNFCNAAQFKAVQWQTWQCAMCFAVQLRAGQCTAPQASGEGISEWLVWAAAVGFPGYLNTEQSLHHPSGQPPMAIA